mmetsp:Transcript_45131/g.149616  ORF Transcript_45131/g.149616 Transcript_45131/m.149616 type:complete len:720 (+) Transcript_45131:1262-3421(+)
MEEPAAGAPAASAAHMHSAGCSLQRLRVSVAVCTERRTLAPAAAAAAGVRRAAAGVGVRRRGGGGGGGGVVPWRRAHRARRQPRVAYAPRLGAVVNLDPTREELRADLVGGLELARLPRRRAPRDRIEDGLLVHRRPVALEAAVAEVAPPTAVAAEAALATPLSAVAAGRAASARAYVALRLARCVARAEERRGRHEARQQLRHVLGRRRQGEGCSGGARGEGAQRLCDLDAAEGGGLAQAARQRRAGQRCQRASDRRRMLRARREDEGGGRRAVGRHERRAERVRVREEEDGLADRVAAALVLGELAQALSHGVDEPRLVDEGEQDDCLPEELLAVEVEREVLGVEVSDLGARVGHQLRERLRQRVRRAGRQHAHQLLERAEGARELEVGRLAGVDGGGEVGGKGGVVVRVEPLPRGAAVVVVPHHPLQALHVRGGDLPPARVVDARELGVVVPILPAGHTEPHLVLLLGRRVLLLDQLRQLALEALRRRLVRALAHLVQPDGPVRLLASRLLAHAQLLAVLVHHRALEPVEPRRHLLRGRAVGRGSELADRLEQLEQRGVVAAKGGDAGRRAVLVARRAAAALPVRGSVLGLLDACVADESGDCVIARSCESLSGAWRELCGGGRGGGAGGGAAEEGERPARRRSLARRRAALRLLPVEKKGVVAVGAALRRSRVGASAHSPHVGPAQHRALGRLRQTQADEGRLEGDGGLDQHQVG